MSWNPALSAADHDTSPDALETLIIPRARDLGGFEVRRALPSPQRQMVGPFIFFDQAGPAEFLTGQGIDVRPHPHIGLGTVTYLYRGDFHHRDSLGTDQVILPGAVNWMVAGKAVTHSERTSEAGRSGPSSLFGIQTWVALPEGVEDRAASFEHHPKDTLPELEAEGIKAKLIMGRAYGETAPVSTFSDMFYLDVMLEAGASVPLPHDHEDRGAYVTSGEIEVAGTTYASGQMMVFRPGDRVSLKAGPSGARLMLLGGETLNGPRYIWWNFVASSKEKIDQAREEWRAAKWGEGLFDLPPDDRDEFIPLP